MKSILLCIAYRPPDCPVSCFVEDFMDNYSYALTFGKDIFVAGDLNCNLLKDSPESEALNEMCNSLNLSQLIKEPTRVTLQSSSLIDVILASNTSLVEKSGVEVTHISDHYLVYSILKLKLPKQLSGYMVTRSFKNYFPERFTSDLAQITWQENSIDNDINQKTDNFNQKFLNVLNRHAPIKTIKIKRRLCPFVDSEIVEIMKTRNMLHRIARETSQALDWDRYRLYKNLVKEKLREAERKFVHNKINNKNNNSNSLWKIIRECIPRKEISRPVYSRNISELANEFNDFFTSVGEKASAESRAMVTTYDLPRTSLEIPIEPCVEDDKFHFHPVSYDVIRRIVYSFPSNKAPGPDKVSMSLIKDALPYILQPLTDIVNCSLRESMFPTAWKLSEVIPLLKEGDHEMANNNRPISLLPAASKICERVALEQLTDYMTQKKCLSEHQSGNKKMHSTETLNLLISDKILKSMDDKEVVAIVLLDLSKAFDSIDHALLLKKLNVLGVSNTATCWFKSYLTERKQAVRIGSTLSEEREITHGVPQGSILGPMLFNIYINDLPMAPKACSLKSFVDDSKLFLSFPINEIKSAVAKLNEDLQRVASWCSLNSLLINPGKTKLLMFGTRYMLKQIPANFHISLLGKKLFPVTSATDLGVTLDSGLKYDEHITKLVSSCIGSLCQINRAKHIFDKNTLVRIINALVFSKLYYCSTIWSNSSKKNIAKLQKVQNFAARIVTGKKKFDHITPSLKQLNWLPVSYMLRFRDTVMVFKCLRGMAPSYLCSMFETRSQLHNLNTRNSGNLEIPLCRTTTGQRSFSYRAVSIWNSLPEWLKNNNFSLQRFKHELKSLLLKEFFEDQNDIFNIS